MSSRPRILIVDDNPHSIALCQVAIGSSYFQLDIARDGFEAIESLKRHAYALMLLDYRMPRLDGAGVLEWMNASLTERPRVLVMTSDLSPTTRALLSGLGCDAILQKPVALPDLHAELHRLAA